MANKKIPLRKCVACNEMKEKKEMIRVIKTPEKGLERSLKTAIPQEVYESLEKEMSTLA